MAAHDLSEGGLAVALAEMCLGGPGWVQVGAKVRVEPNGRLDQLLFGEDHSRIVVAFEPSEQATVESICQSIGAPLLYLGETGGERLEIAGKDGRTLASIGVKELQGSYDTGLCEALGIAEVN